MERVKLRCRGSCLGEITLRDQGGRTEAQATMEDPGDGLYRAVLRGERGELMLGVLAPEEGVLTLRRTVYTRDIAALGRLEEGEARQSFPFRPAGWRETRCPAQLFRSPFFQVRLRGAGRAWWRREESLLLLALPVEAGRPFPLECLFCLGRLERVDGEMCVVYAFQEEEPALPP